MQTRAGFAVLVDDAGRLAETPPAEAKIGNYVGQVGYDAMPCVRCNTETYQLRFRVNDHLVKMLFKFLAYLRTLRIP
jgi:hypothetical protein